MTYRPGSSVKPVETILSRLNLDRLCRWSESWGLSLNPSKCKILTLSLRRSPVVSTYSIDGTAIERVTVMRDLGVLLDEKLTFGPHVDSNGMYLRRTEH